MSIHPYMNYYFQYHFSHYSILLWITISLDYFSYSFIHINYHILDITWQIHVKNILLINFISWDPRQSKNIIKSSRILDVPYISWNNMMYFSSCHEIQILHRSYSSSSTPYRFRIFLIFTLQNPEAMLVVPTIYTILIFYFISITGSMADESLYFNRDAKWTNLAPSGGSLVSGRGNYRPGFARQGPYDPRTFIAEPLFAFKVSSLPHWPWLKKFKMAFQRSHRLLPSFRTTQSRSMMNLLHYWLVWNAFSLVIIMIVGDINPRINVCRCFYQLHFSCWNISKYTRTSCWNNILRKNSNFFKNYEKS